MSLKVKRALSLFLSLMVVLVQTSSPTFASSSEEYRDETSIDETVGEIIEEVVPYTPAVNPYAVYTQITRSTLDRSGNGTAEFPYNRFEDAVANVANGGTIIIKTGRSGFINAQDEYGQIPFIIDKDVTIRSESSSKKATLDVRAAGIVLEGNVTFENIEFAFANKVHDSIFANGYTLEIIDCMRSSAGREIDLFAGSLYNTSGKLIDGMKYTGTAQGRLIRPKVGNNSQIIIKTTSKSTKSQFGKVFAGSMNAPFDGDVNIEIVNNGILELVGIYGCGGHEAKVGNMFDVTEPLPPEERPDDYIVDGTVNISMDKYITNVHGKGGNEVNLELATQYPVAHFSLDDINTLTIHEGRFIPNEIIWKDTPGDIILSSQDAHLDLSEMKDDNDENKFIVNNFNGGGILTLQKEGELTIIGEIEGETVFQTAGGGENFSGTVIPLHAYIVNPSKTGTYNSFKFTPSYLQTGCTLDLDTDTGNWVTSDFNFILPDSITKLAFKKDEIILESDTKEFLGYSNPFEVETNLADDLLDTLFLPYELSVTGHHVDYDTEYGIWNVEAANLSFYIGQDNDTILPTLCVTAIQYDQPITPGKYEVTISLSDYGVSSSYILNVVSDASVSEAHYLDITITNNNSSDHIINFGDEVTIATNIKENSSLIEGYALQNEYDFYINDKLVHSGAKNSHIMSVDKDLFKVGENVIKVIYGGSDVIERLVGSTVVDVDKTKCTINLSPNIEVIYDGKPHTLTASIEAIADVKPVVYYYTDESYTNGETTTAPVNVGRYYVKAVLPESEYYTASDATGTITIQKATPQISLSGIPKNDNELEISVSMIYPQAGKIPNGIIQLDLMDSMGNLASNTIELKNGSLTHTFSNVAFGEVTVTATYIPEINENGNIYNDPFYNGMTPISERFDVVKDYIPVQNIEFIAPQLQCYVQFDGTQYQNLTNMQLPVVITPNNASNQDITWTSINPDIITIDEKGQVEAHKPGQGIIVATAKGGNIAHTCEVTVLEMTADIVPVESISFDKSSMNLDLTTHLTGVINVTLHSAYVNIEPTYADVTWKSMDTNIIDIKAVGHSKMAVIEAKGEGITTAVAVTKDGAKVATCTVQVTQKQSGSNEGAGNGDIIQQPSTPASKFTDITNHWAKEDIQFVVEKGLFNGVSETSFGVNQSTTRGMVVTVLHRLAGTPQLGTVSFSDVKSGLYYTDAVAWAHTLGIVSGVNQTHFMPNQNITREQLVVMLYNYVRILNPNIKNSKVDLSQFKDVTHISNWSKDAMKWAVNVGILKGNTNNQLQPKANATRAEVAVMMRRFIDLL